MKEEIFMGESHKTCSSFSRTAGNSDTRLCDSTLDSVQRNKTLHGISK